MSVSVDLTSAVSPRATTSGVESGSIRAWGISLVALSVCVWGAGVFIGFRAALAILVGLAFLAATVGLAFPVLGMFAIGMLCTLDVLMRHLLTPYGWLRYNTFNYWLLIVGVAGLPLLLRRSDPHMRLYQALLLIVVLGLVWSPAFWSGVLEVLSLVSLSGVFVYMQRGAKNSEIWYWLGMVNGVLGAAGGALFYAQRATMPYFNPNAFYHFPFMGILSICLAFHACSFRRGQLYLLGSLLAVNVCWIFLSGSRGGLLVTALCLVYLIWKLPGTIQRFGVLAIAALLTLAVFSQFEQLRDHTLGRVTKLLDSRSTASQRTSGRSNLAWGAWQMFVDAPLTGVGTGGFSTTWGRRSQEIGFPKFRVGQDMFAHSAWLTILAENGVFGIALFAPLIGSFAIVGWRRRKEGMLALGILATCVLSAAFVTTEFQGKGLWFLMASAMTLLHPPKAGTACHGINEPTFPPATLV